MHKLYSKFVESLSTRMFGITACDAIKTGMTACDAVKTDNSFLAEKMKLDGQETKRKQDKKKRYENIIRQRELHYLDIAQRLDTILEKDMNERDNLVKKLDELNYERKYNIQKNETKRLLNRYKKCIKHIIRIKEIAKPKSLRERKKTETEK